MNDDLEHIFLRLGCGGAEDKAEQSGLLRRAAEILRSGEALSAAAQEKLADLIDPIKIRFPYKLMLVEDSKTKRIYDKNADDMAIALELEMRTQDNASTTSDAVLDISEEHGISDRTVYRKLKDNRANFPNGCPEETKMIYKLARQFFSEPTDKK